VYHSGLSETNTLLDDINWQYTTNWLSSYFTIPLDWDEGIYRLGFGVINVQNANNDSFVGIDNITLFDIPDTLIGNTILDPNNDIFSIDPLGAIDSLVINDDKISEISFDSQGDANEYINTYGLVGYSAVATGIMVSIPLPSSGENITFTTPAGGLLSINKEGNYQYTFPQQSEWLQETFNYILSSQDSAEHSDAKLTIYLVNELQPQPNIIDRL